MTAPSFVAGTEQDGNQGGNPATVTWGAGNASDIIVIAWGAYQYIAAVAVSMSGFTPFGVHQGGNSGQFEAGTGFLVKAAGTTASGSGLMSATNANSASVDWISVRIAGADTTVLAEDSIGNGGNGLTVSVPSLTSGGADRLMLIANFLNQPFVTPYPGFTNFAKWSASDAEGIWSKTITSAGATGTISGTTSGANTGWGASALMIPPAAGASPDATATPTVLNTQWSYPAPSILLVGDPNAVPPPTVTSGLRWVTRTR